MKNVVRFSDYFLNKNAKNMVEKVIGNINHLNNVKCAAIVNTILTEERYQAQQYRSFIPHKNKNYFSLDQLIAESFFKCFSDVIIVDNSHLNNLLFDEFLNSKVFNKALLEATPNKKVKKTVFVIDKNPNIKFYLNHKIFSNNSLDFQVFYSNSKFDYSKSDKSSLKNISFNKVDNSKLNLKNLIEESFKFGSNLTYIEGLTINTLKMINEEINLINELNEKWELEKITNNNDNDNSSNKVMSLNDLYSDIYNQNLNNTIENPSNNVVIPIDMLMNFSYFKDGFMFQSASKNILNTIMKGANKMSKDKLSELRKRNEIKYLKIDEKTKSEIISLSGNKIDLFDKIELEYELYLTKNFSKLELENEEKNSSIDDTNLEINDLWLLDVYKRKNIFQPELSKNSEEYLTTGDRRRNMKDKEKIRNLMRDN